MIELEKVRQTLAELKLTTAASYLESRLQYAAEHEMSYAAFLSDILGAELEERNKRQTEAKIHRAHLPYRKTFEEFDFAYQPTVDPKRVENLRTFAFVESASNVILLGPPGVGKSHPGSSPGARSHSSWLHSLLRQYKPSCRQFTQCAQRGQAGRCDEEIHKAKASRD